jgi:hypothetical protein
MAVEARVLSSYKMRSVTRLLPVLTGSACLCAMLQVFGPTNEMPWLVFCVDREKTCPRLARVRKK